jgi:hypothetical protein
MKNKWAESLEAYRASIILLTTAGTPDNKTFITVNVGHCVYYKLVQSIRRTINIMQTQKELYVALITAPFTQIRQTYQRYRI